MPARAYLEALPTRESTADGVVVAHGSLDDPERYVASADRAAAELEHDLDRRELDFHAVRYDTASTRDALRRHGLPDDAYRLRPSPRGAAALSLRRIGRR